MQTANVSRPRRADYGIAKVERLEIDCRGYEPPWGVVRHAKSCRVRRVDLRAAAARQRKGFREGDRTYVCEACSGLRLPVQRVAKIVDAWVRGEPSPIADVLERVAADGRIRSWAANDDVQRALTALAVFGRDVARSTVEARVSGRQRSIARRSALVARGAAAAPPRAPRWLAAQWVRGVPGREIRSCLRCGRLLQVQLTPTAKKPEMHAACYNDATRTPKAREWLRRRHRLALDGVPGWQARRKVGEMPIDRLPGVTGRRDPESLTRQLTWAVRHLVGGEPQSAIAADEHVTRAAVGKGITAVLELLPDPAIADARFRPWVERLLAASAER